VPSAVSTLYIITSSAGISWNSQLKSEIPLKHKPINAYYRLLNFRHRKKAEIPEILSPLSGSVSGGHNWAIYPFRISTLHLSTYDLWLTTYD